MNEHECTRLKAEVARRLRRQKQLCTTMRRRQHWHGARLLYYQNAQSCRSIAQQLIGWRAGMVFVYATAILISALFWEIVVGYNLAMLAVGLVGAGGIVALHYLPGDGRLMRAQQFAGEEFARLCEELRYEQAAKEQLHRQHKELAAHLSQLQAVARPTQIQPQIIAQRAVAQAMPMSTTDKKRTDTKVQWCVAIVSVLVLSGIVHMINPSDPDRERREAENERLIEQQQRALSESAERTGALPTDTMNTRAWIAAQHVIRDRLKAPATATFGGEDIEREGDTYRVNGWVDAQNTFGAMLRSRFVVRMRYVDGGWDLVEAPSMAE